MADVTFAVTPATPQKRPYEEECIVPDQFAVGVPASHSGAAGSSSASRQGSPAPSSDSSLTELTASHDTPGSATKPSETPASKKPKLTFIEKQAEKAAKQREKEEKARQKAEEKAEEKARKEEEKARKDEEKRRAAEEKEATKRAKDLEKAEKQKVKDEEKARKDAEKAAKEKEKQAKEDEKERERLKKERVSLYIRISSDSHADILQDSMRFKAFFGQAKPESTPPSTPEDVSEGASSRRSSIASIDMERHVLEQKKSGEPSNPEYSRFILPFFVPDNTDLAPTNRFKLGHEVEFEVTPDSTTTSIDVHDQFSRPKKRMRRTIPVREIISNMQATGLEVVDLDSPTMEALEKASYKCLQFREDVRPPYQGTYTRLVTPRTARKISRHPFTRALPDTNYDYDSEAEWEPPGEDDEDLDLEDEMSDAEDGAEEMDDFLDDAEDIARKKGPLADMEPITSGLCWVGQDFDDHGTNLQQYHIDVLHDSTTFPIDPFSSRHWDEDCRPKPMKQESYSAVMQPPRLPLSSLSPNTTSVVKLESAINSKPGSSNSKKKANNDKQPKLIDANFMEDFRKAVSGSDLTKIGLIEVLKKQFPQCSKEAIKDTLSAVAVRVGKKETEKKWQLVDSA